MSTKAYQFLRKSFGPKFIEDQAVIKFLRLKLLQTMLLHALRECLVLAFAVKLVTAHQCGELLFSKGFTIRGEAITRGQWPYLVALVNVAENSFFCGGSLISAKHVLTGKIHDKSSVLLTITHKFKLRGQRP